ncbi:hypothetical protein TFLX_04806 [Thermoflexales bacterium]|nr:hypothetical protein TFLX_04806 [Thermoflexales bacterium]
MRELDQIEVVGETLRYTLNVLATVALEWLRPCLNSDWAKRYGERLNGYRLPKEKHERQALLKVIGQDGYQLLEHLAQATEQPWLTKLPAVKLVRQV